jgi:hypothetical protein
MESPKAQVRAILPLGKGRVVDRGPGHFKIAIGGSTTITITMPMDHYDIRDGDLLSLYTEVLLAQPSQPPIQ